MHYFNRAPSNAQVSNDSAALRGLLIHKQQRNCYTIIRGRYERDLCVVCFGVEHAQSALEGAKCAHS